MKIQNFLTPQVRTFIYGAVAALLSVATVQGWVSDNLAKSIQDNLPTIIGAISSIIAAANVKQKPVVVESPVVETVTVTATPDRIDFPVARANQAPAVES